MFLRRTKMSVVPRPSLGALFAALLVAASQPGFAAPPAPPTPTKEALPLSEPEVASAWACGNERNQIFSVAQAVLQGSGKRRVLPNDNHRYLGYGADGHSARPDRPGATVATPNTTAGRALSAGRSSSFGLIASRFASLTRGASRISASLRFPSAKLPSPRSEKLEPFQSMF